MNGFKETEIGLIPEDWEVVRLGDIAEVKYGKANPKNRGTIPVVGSGGVYSRTLIPLVDYPTLVIGRKGTAGKVWLFLTPCYPSDTTFYLKWKKNVDVSFLFNYLVLNPLSGEHAKTTLPSLQKPDLENSLIPYPPLPEQKKIAAVLSAVQEAKEKTEQVVKATKELKKSLMKHLFTYGPVPVGAIHELPLRQTEIGLVPEEWGVVPFPDAILKESVRVGKVKRQEYKALGTFPIIDQGQKQIAGYWNNPNDVYQGSLPIIVFGDHTRIFKLVTFPFVCGADGTKVLIPDQRKFETTFFFYVMLNLEIPSRGYNRHYPLLKEQKLPCPPFHEQRKIAEILSSVDQRIEAEENKKNALEELFKTLLNNLMTGKIRVNYLEIKE